MSTCTVVTAYYRIPSKRDHKQYEEWIANFMSLPMHTVIYGDKDSLDFLQKSYPVAAAAAPQGQRRYVLRPFSAFATSKWDWEKEVAADHEVAVGHNARLYQVWAEKIFMVADAIAANPYGSTQFVWCDIGSFRDAAWLPRLQGFPCGSAVPLDRVGFLQVAPFSAEDAAAAAGPLTDRFKHRNGVGGTVFGGGAAALLQFRDVYAAMLDEADSRGVFKGKDQSLYAWLTLRHPALFQRIPAYDAGYEPWFALHWLWGGLKTPAPLRIVLVGPGIMAIPPTGWGACEILIWDLATALRTAGHTVEILNTPDMAAVVSRVAEVAPDFVHIHYDDHAWVAPLLARHARAVGITSHYGYLEQPQRWGSWVNTFRQIIGAGSPTGNVHHLVLSAGIRELYLKAGVQPSRVFVTPNGADATKFRFTPAPAHGDRSIVVGKLEGRKGQWRLLDAEDVWFAGNHGRDGSFPPSHPRWLGEWDKPTLYDSLTDYGNLVLLSNGEADPLVVKEALMAGLGVVVTPAAAANLDAAAPFITVLPNERLEDRLFVAQEIRKNRAAALAQRDAIRAYALANFSWEGLTNKYVELVRTLAAASSTA